MPATFSTGLISKKGFCHAASKDHTDVLKCIYIFKRISLIAAILSIIMLFSVDNDSVDF